MWIRVRDALAPGDVVLSAADMPTTGDNASAEVNANDSRALVTWPMGTPSIVLSSSCDAGASVHGSNRQGQCHCCCDVRCTVRGLYSGAVLTDDREFSVSPR